VPVVSAAQVRAVMRGATSADDTLIDVLVARADSALALALGYPMPDSGTRTLGAATYTLYPGPLAIDRDEPAILSLAVRPVVSVTSVHVDPERSYGAATAIASGDRDLDGARGLIILRDTATSTWSRALRANKVVVSAGWSTLPAEVAHALILQVGHWLAHSSAAGRVSVDDGQTRVDLAALSLLPEVVSLCRGYRLVAP
jgi:hypothetical protein